MTEDRQPPTADERQNDAPDAEGADLYDPGAKTQPAEGGRDEVEESIDESTTDGSLTPGAPNER